MRFHFILRESIQALRSNYLRSLLTVIGIIVGIFSVTAMLALGAGLSENVQSQFNSFAQGDLTVSGPSTVTDLAWVIDQPYVDSAIGTVRVSGAKVVAFETEFAPTVQAVVGDYQAVTQYTVQEGIDFDFSDPTIAESVVVVSQTFAEAVIDETGQSILNQNIVLNNQTFKVIGIIDGNVSSFSQGDGMILVPYAATIGIITSARDFSSISILLKDSTLFEITGQAVLASLNASRQLAAESDDLFTIETSQSIIETVQQTVGLITTFLGVVGGIALFVGGIGTMNMMLTTVTERTKEIGLRKAVGARNRDILLQILCESVLLTTFGGIIGIVLTLGAAFFANQILAGNEIISIVVNYEVIALATVVAIAVGVVFGIYPARNASRLQPVDALRSE